MRAREREREVEETRGKDRFQRTRVGGGTSGARPRSASRSEVNLSGNALGQHVWQGPLSPSSPSWSRTFHD